MLAIDIDKKAASIGAVRFLSMNNECSTVESRRNTCTSMIARAVAHAPGHSCDGVTK